MAAGPGSAGPAAAAVDGKGAGGLANLPTAPAPPSLTADEGTWGERLHRRLTLFHNMPCTQHSFAWATGLSVLIGLHKLRYTGSPRRALLNATVGFFGVHAYVWFYCAFDMATAGQALKENTEEQPGLLEVEVPGPAPPPPSAS